MASRPRAGWYPDHQAPEGHLRYWDGTGWTEQRSVTQERSEREVGPVREWLERAVAGAVVAAFVVTIAVVYRDYRDPGTDLAVSGDRDRVPAAASEVSPDPEESPDLGAEGVDGSAPVTKADPGGGPRAYLVESVLDGDTVRLANGAEVRLVGLSAPDLGECGSEDAVGFLARLVVGRYVVLRKPGADKGPDGRLLRYLLIGSSDIGLRLLRQGVAVADGTGWVGAGHHPRHQTYLRASAQAPAPSCGPDASR